MADLSQIEVNGVTYKTKDTNARELLFEYCDEGYSKENLTKELDWSMGYFDTDNGTYHTSSRTTYTTNILQFDKPVLVTCDDFDTYEISVVFYNKTADTRFYGTWFTTKEIPIPKGYRFRVQMRGRETGAMNPDIYNHCFVYKLHTLLDGLLVKGISNANGLIISDSNARNYGFIEPLKLKNDSVVGLKDYDTYKYTLQVFGDYSAYEIAEETYYSIRTDVKVSAGKYVRIIVNRIDLSNAITADEVNEQIKIKEVETYKEYVKEQVDGIAYDIAEVRNRVVALESGNAIPSYYETHIASKASTINGYRDELTTGTQFIFITDVHVNGYNQTMHSKALLHYLCENTLISEVFNGGDIANGGVNPHLGKVEFLKQARKGIEYCNPDSYAKVFFVAGNHDLGIDYSGNQTAGAIITAQELYDVSGIKGNVLSIEQDVNTPFNYTYADDTNKIYYVVCTANLRDTVTGESYKNVYIWFCNALKKCPDNYTIVVLNHEIINSSSNQTLISFIGDICNVIDAYNARGSSPKYADEPSTIISFANCGGEVCCLIGGHSHIDFSTATTGGVPVIVTTTDNCGAESSASGLTRTAGTVSEQAFDVFTIDTTNKVIKATRVGAGSDRTFSY